MVDKKRVEELAATLPEKWRTAFSLFVETGEAEEAFMDFLDSDKAAQDAVDSILADESDQLKVMFDAAIAVLEKVQGSTGKKMADGTVFAGISPDTGRPMFTTQADAPLTYTFRQARKYAASLDVNGHQDWRVPTKSELKVLFNNRASIGGFNVSGEYRTGSYWSSSQEYFTGGAWALEFQHGGSSFERKCDPASLRCVRG